MDKYDIIKYSNQIIAYKSNKEYNVANGFFLRVRTYLYFITANHAVTQDNCLDIVSSIPIDSIYFILGVDGDDFETKTIQLDRWEFFDSYEFDNKFRFSLPSLYKREDLAICGIDIEEVKSKLIMLPFKIINSLPNTCHNKKISVIDLPLNIGYPNKNKNYYLGGKVLKKISTILAENEEHFYESIRYLNESDGYYYFHISDDISNIDGLSGSPLFDEEIKLVGMVIRYNYNDKNLVVLPSSRIYDYIEDDLRWVDYCYNIEYATS